jgi:uncharacterized membrane protein YdjX (TVP38/TMEM64 family)
MKKVFTKDFLPVFLGVIILVVLFSLASFFAGKYQAQMHSLVANDNMLGMAAYILLTVLAVVFAPVSTLPLIPLASGVWGWFTAGVLSIIGWTMGAQTAFLLARRFGKPLVQKIVSLEKLQRIEDRIPKGHIFWTVVFLRISVPVDVLSYALGLFSRMKSVPYFFATLLGVAPFAFVFSYVGTLPFSYQMEALGFAVFVMLLAYLKKRLA